MSYQTIRLVCHFVALLSRFRRVLTSVLRCYKWYCITDQEVVRCNYLEGLKVHANPFYQPIFLSADTLNSEENRLFSKRSQDLLK